MKTLITRLLMTFIAVAALAHSASAETMIGVVDTQKIMRDSKAAQSVRTQMQQKQKAFQNELDAKEKQLRDEYQSLGKQKNTIEQAAFEQKVKEFRAKEVGAQREIQSKKLQIDKALAKSLETIQKTTYDIVRAMAVEKKLNLVIYSTQVIYAEPQMDITNDVLTKLDSKLPTVSVAL